MSGTPHCSSRLWAAAIVAVAASLVVACTNESGDATVEANRSGQVGTATTQPQALAGFCQAFTEAVAAQQQRLLDLYSEMTTSTVTTAVGELPMDGVLSTAFGLFADASAASIEMLLSLPRPLPDEIASAVDRAITIHQVYVDGMVPSEDQVDELSDLNDSIITYANEQCGLNISLDTSI